MKSATILRALKTLEYWISAKLLLGALALLRMLPADWALDIAARAARRFGPLTGRHRVALDNLRQAYPEKSEDEIRRIALEMWGNMARLAAEYVFLDEIYDLDLDADEPGRIEITGGDIFQRLVKDPRPRIFFTAHLGNFELLPICAAAYDLEVTALFRPPNNPYFAEHVLAARHTRKGHLVPSKAGAAWSLARILDEGGNVGVLVDQAFDKGVRTTFFGRSCRTNPLLVKLARQYDCEIYPARCIRLPDNRYRLDLFEKIELVRDAGGTVDVTASCQRINDIVEGWVREYPEQWTWFHKRWKRGWGD